jgi:hypothetical protein
MVSFTERSASADPFRVWKIYCFVLAAFLALMYVVLFAAALRPMLLVDFAITVVSFFWAVWVRVSQEIWLARILASAMFYFSVVGPGL